MSSAVNQAQDELPIWLYRVPILPATADNQSVQLVLTSVETHLPVPFDVHLQYPPSYIGTRGPMDHFGCSSSSALSVTSLRQKKCGNSSGQTLDVMTVGRDSSKSSVGRFNEFSRDLLKFVSGCSPQTCTLDHLISISMCVTVIYAAEYKQILLLNCSTAFFWERDHFDTCIPNCIATVGISADVSHTTKSYKRMQPVMKL